MYRSTLAILLLAFLLSACANPTPLPAAETGTPTVNLTPVTGTPDTVAPDSAASPKGDTSTPQPPTPTPTLSTPTRTPLPTIPTFTPTFDVRTIVTATPAPKAVCPKEDPLAKMDLIFPKNFEDMFNPDSVNEEKILNYLNRGGNISRLAMLIGKAYRDAYGWKVERGEQLYAFDDLTADGVKELLMQDFSGSGYTNIFIFKCSDGKYQSFWINKDFGAVSSANVLAIKDLNRNGIPDIVMDYGSDYIIYEWNGSYFKPLSYDEQKPWPFNWPFINSQTNLPEIKDINNDGFEELILTGADIYYYGIDGNFHEAIYYPQVGFCR